MLVNSIHESDFEFQEFFSNIFEDGLMVSGIQIKYNHKYRSIRSKGTGQTINSLPNSFINLMEQQLNELFVDFVIPMIQMINFSFELNVEVEKTGILRLDKINIVLRVDCNSQRPKDFFTTPARIILPFLECTDYVRVRGRNHTISVFESNINGTVEELRELIRKPIVGPTAKKQWFHFTQIAMKDVKRDFHYEMSVPVLDAEIIFEEGTVRCVQHVVYLDERCKPLP